MVTQLLYELPGSQLLHVMAVRHTGVTGVILQEFDTGHLSYVTCIYAVQKFITESILFHRHLPPKCTLASFTCRVYKIEDGALSY